VVSLLIPDCEGKLDDVVLGYDSLAGYLSKSPYFGCLVGRYGNRIAKGQFKLDGQPIRWPRTTARTTCTVARLVSTRWSGRPNQFLPKIAWLAVAVSQPRR